MLGTESFPSLLTTLWSRDTSFKNEWFLVSKKKKEWVVPLLRFFPYRPTRERTTNAFHLLIIKQGFMICLWPSDAECVRDLVVPTGCRWWGRSIDFSSSFTYFAHRVIGDSASSCLQSQVDPLPINLWWGKPK